MPLKHAFAVESWHSCVPTTPEKGNPFLEIRVLIDHGGNAPHPATFWATRFERHVLCGIRVVIGFGAFEPDVSDPRHAQIRNHEPFWLVCDRGPAVLMTDAPTPA